MDHLNKYGEIEDSGCPKCGEAVKPEWVACPACGVQLQGTNHHKRTASADNTAPRFSVFCHVCNKDVTVMTGNPPRVVCPPVDMRLAPVA